MIIVGHRGARNEAPENTIESFAHAYQNGCQHFELDIQLSSDHELIVFHDTSLKRTTGYRGKLTNFPYHFLKTLDASLCMPNWPSPCFVPSLQAVVKATPNTQHWQFEVKTDRRDRLIILIQKLYPFIMSNNLADKVTVTSSNRWFLKEMATTHPEISTGYVAELPFIDPVKVARKLKCKLLAISVDLINETHIKHAQAADLEISCWTVNEIDKMRALKKMGVQSIITDIPSLAIQSLS